MRAGRKSMRTGMEASEFHRLRLLTGLSQEMVGVTVLGVSARTVARWESGESRISELEAGEIRRRLLAAAGSVGPDRMSGQAKQRAKAL